MTENAYKDEQPKLDRKMADEFAVWCKIYEVLNDYGYDLVPAIKDGMPEMKLVKETPATS